MNWDDYVNKVPYPAADMKMSKERRREMRKAYTAEEGRLTNQFRDDALKELGVDGHPKAQRLFDIAWDNGHASGYQEVFMWMDQLADLLRDGGAS